MDRHQILRKAARDLTDIENALIYLRDSLPSVKFDLGPVRVPPLVGPLDACHWEGQMEFRFGRCGRKVMDDMGVFCYSHLITAGGHRFKWADGPRFTLAKDRDLNSFCISCGLPIRGERSNLCAHRPKRIEMLALLPIWYLREQASAGRISDADIASLERALIDLGRGDHLPVGEISRTSQGQVPDSPTP